MRILTPEFRVSYPNVFEPKLNKLSGKTEYSLTALFPLNADLSGLKAEVKRVVEEKWGKDQKKWPKNLRSPFRLQDERAKEVDGKSVMPPGHVEGAVFLNLKSKDAPGVVDQNVQKIIDTSEFYAGCWAKASINAYAYSQAGNNGVSFGLGNIQKVRDDDPLGSRTLPEHDFVPVENSGANGATDGDATNLF